MKRQVTLHNIESGIDQSSAYAMKCIVTHEEELRRKYGDKILAIREGEGVVGSDTELERLVKAMFKEGETGIIVYGTLNGFLEVKREFEEALK